MQRTSARGRVKRTAATVACYFLCGLCAALGQTPAQPERGPALVLSSGDPETVFGDVFAFWRTYGGPLPRLVACEPGPIVLAAGLRLLPHEVAPRVAPPEVLLLAGFGNLALTDGLTAVVRHCWAEGVPVWVVGDFPEGLAGLAPPPGARIVRVAPEQLGASLAALRENPTNAGPGEIKYPE